MIGRFGRFYVTVELIERLKGRVLERGLFLYKGREIAQGKILQLRVKVGTDVIEGKQKGLLEGQCLDRVVERQINGLVLNDSRNVANKAKCSLKGCQCTVLFQLSKDE